jgi:uncharacterized DUF497 family protein
VEYEWDEVKAESNRRKHLPVGCHPADLGS